MWLQLTAEVKQMVEEEAVLVEGLKGRDAGFWQVPPQGLVSSLLRDQGLQHGTHHVQLEREKGRGGEEEEGGRREEENGEGGLRGFHQLGIKCLRRGNGPTPNVSTSHMPNLC